MFMAGFKEKTGQGAALIANGLLYQMITLVIGYFWYRRMNDPRYMSYIALAQLLTLPRSRIYWDVSKRIKLRMLDPLLTKPSSLIYQYYLYDLGRGTATFLFILPFAIPFFVFAGFPSPIFIILFPLSFTISFFIAFIIGLSAVWIGEAKPAAWVTTKFKIITGGAIIPLSIIKGKLGILLDALPFRSIAFFPAYASVFGFSWRDFLLAIFHAALLYLIAKYTEKMAVKKYVLGN